MGRHTHDKYMYMLQEYFPQNNIIAPITRFSLKWETHRKNRNSQRSFKENAFQVLSISHYFTW